MKTIFIALFAIFTVLNANAQDASDMNANELEVLNQVQEHLGNDFHDALDAIAGLVGEVRWYCEEFTENTNSKYGIFAIIDTKLQNVYILTIALSDEPSNSHTTYGYIMSVYPNAYSTDSRPLSDFEIKRLFSKHGYTFNL